MSEDYSEIDVKFKKFNLKVVTYVIILGFNIHCESNFNSLKCLAFSRYTYKQS